MTIRDRDALLALGSNIAPEQHVPHALALLHDRFEVVRRSRRYRTRAVGGRGVQPDFVNFALRVRTDLPPRALREACRRIEDACGRRRTEDRCAPRTMDVDVLLLDDLVLDLDAWRLPDPQLHVEPFLLVPAAEAWPEAVHPVLGLPLALLARSLPSLALEGLVPLPDP